jgi:tetratricopeptide (TPR) repeat protein
MTTPSFLCSLRRSFGAVGLVVWVAVAHAAVEPTHLDAALALFRTNGKSLEAQQAFEAISKEDPANVQAQLYLSRLAMRRNDHDKSVAYAERAAQLAPNDAECHNVLGDAYGRAAQAASVFRQLGLGKKCLAAYQRAVELAPNRIEFRKSLFNFYSQAPGFAGGGFDKAVAQATAIKQLDPAEGRLTFAALYLGEKKYDLAFAQFDEVLKTNPDDYAALYQIGRLAALSGHAIDRGIASLRRCLELTPPPTTSHAAAHWRLGNLLEKKSDPAGARRAYEASVKIDPNFAPAVEALKKLK